MLQAMCTLLITPGFIVCIRMVRMLRCPGVVSVIKTLNELPTSQFGIC